MKILNGNFSYFRGDFFFFELRFFVTSSQGKLSSKVLGSCSTSYVYERSLRVVDKYQIAFALQCDMGFQGGPCEVATLGEGVLIRLFFLTCLSVMLWFLNLHYSQ